MSNIINVNGMLFITITKMSNDRFNDLNIEDFMKWIFPVKDQSNPELRESDIKCIKY